MSKFYITTTYFQCPICGAKILEEWITQEEPSPQEIARMNDTSRDNHIRLHKIADKYRRIESVIERLNEITGGDEER